MMKKLRIALILGLSVLAASCAQNIKSDVARFHRFQNVSQGATFAIVPANPAMEGSLEFAQYAGLVRAQMVNLGFEPVNSANASDLVVSFNYAVSDGDQVIRTRFNGLGGAGFGPVGWRRFGGVYDPFLFGGGFGGFGGWGAGFGGGPNVYSYEVFTRDLQLQIYEPETPNVQKRVVFEGKVQSVGRDNRLPEVMPYLVEAMFTDFPGQSGITKEVVIEVPRT